jgi:hypothetical protein
VHDVVANHRPLWAACVVADELDDVATNYLLLQALHVLLLEDCMMLLLLSAVAGVAFPLTEVWLMLL